MTSTREGIFLFVTILIITAVGYLLYREKKLRKYATIFSILGIGLTLRIFVSLDPYLHEWDEKYHALVGKNLTTGVKEPALFATPVHDYDFRKWTANHIWLEKGPIPLLLIGYSAKVFGYSELSVRIPSIILGTLSILLTFLIARKLFTTQTAYYASFLHSINGLIIELNGGRISSDHVESLFIITVEISFYVMLIFFERKTNRGALAFLFGISIGFSILTKWAPALLPFLVFCFVLIVKEKRPFYFARKYGFRAILGITIIVAPYFLYLHASYPTEFEWVLKKFLLAYNNTVELHQGEWWYYINKIGVVFGETCIIVLLITLFVTIKKRIGDSYY